MSMHTRQPGILLWSGLCLLALLISAPQVQAQSSTPEELILRTRYATDLARTSMSDMVEPVGALLGRISPSSSFATANRGFGYGAISFGATGLSFEITDPDYSTSDSGGETESITGPAGAVFIDTEIGLYSGYGRTSKLKNVGSVDLLLRFGASLGDQDDLSQELDLQSWAPIYGAGLRLGVIRGESLPSVSLSVGMNHFTERSFRVLGTTEGEEFEVDLNFRQTSSFLLAEVGKQWRGLLPYAGGGIVWHRLESGYRAEVVHDGTDSPTVIRDAADTYEHQGTFFGGLELGSGFFRLVLETGSSSGNFYGTFFIKLLPFPGYSR